MFDPGIPKFNIEGEEYDSLTRSYTFQGYQIYQLADETVSAAELIILKRLVKFSNVT